MAHHLLSGLGYFRDSDNESYTRNQQHIYKVCPTFMRHYDSVIPVSAVPAFSGDLLSSSCLSLLRCCALIVFAVYYQLQFSYELQDNAVTLTDR